MNKTISVLYTTDDNGFNMLTVSMYSLLQNKNINTLVNIYIAHKKDFSGEHKEYCKKLCDIYKCNIFFIEMSQYEKEYDLEHIYKFVEFENARSWPSPMFYYFYAGMFLPKDIIKILYLDIDTIILGDLSEAYEQQLPFMFTGVRDFVISYYIRWQNKTLLRKSGEVSYFHKLYIDKDFNKYANYINSGVIFIDLNKLRKVDFVDFMKIAHEINKSDEELLNFYFHKDIGNIDMRYNMGLHLYVDKFINIIINITGIDKQYLNDELLNCFKIIHYTTYYKPNRWFNDDTKKIISKIGGVKLFLNIAESYSINKQINRKIDLSDEESKKLVSIIDEYNLVKNMYSKTPGILNLLGMWGIYWEKTQLTLKI